MIDKTDDKVDKLMEKEKREMKRITSILDNTYPLFQLVNQKDQFKDINSLLFKIEEEIQVSPDLLEFSKKILNEKVGYYLKLVHPLVHFIQK